jgi:predicted phage tail protein
MTQASSLASVEPVQFLADVIGKPWGDLASGPDAFDCGGLFGFAQDKLFGRAIPWSGDFVKDATSIREVMEAIRKTNLQRRWVLTEKPRHGDAVLMASHAVISHIGTWIDAGPGLCGVLHSERTGGVMLQSLAEIEADWSRVEFRRCVDGPLHALESSSANLLEHVVDGAALVVARDAMNPLAEAEVIDIEPGTSLIDAMHAADIPLTEYWVCLNETPLLRCHPETREDEWQTVILGAQDVAWVLPMPPEGKKGGSQILATLLSIVVAIAAPFAVGALGGSFVTAGGALSLSGKLLSAGLAIGANLLIASFVPPPPVVAPLANADPTYGFGTVQNQLRPGAVIPRLYGTMRRKPDLLAQPWAEYQENAQIIHILLCVGQGEHQVAEFGFSDTAAWTRENGLTGAIADLEYEIIEPGQTATLFPSSIEVNSEVDGIEMPEPDPDDGIQPLGPFVAVSSGQKANRLTFDFAFPRGLFDGDSGTSDASVSWRIQARRIDDLGQQVNFWEVLDDITFTNNNTTPQRLTRGYDVPEGRYEVLAYRTSESSTSSQAAQDAIAWLGLRAHLVADTAYEDVTAIALRIKADATSAQSVREWYVKSTAVLPHFDLATGELVLGPTEAIEAAALDVLRAEYGLGFADKRIDMPALLNLARVWADRGDVCCTSIEADTGCWDVLESVLTAGRTRPQMIGAKVTFVRDQRRAVVSRVIDHSQMVRGSLDIERSHFRRDSPNVVTMQYRDRRGNLASIECRPEGVDDVRSATVRTQVMVDAAQVYREGLYMAATNNLRRRFPSWVMLSGGASLVRGQLVQVSHPRAGWGTPRKVHFAGSWPRLTLSAPHELTGQRLWLTLVKPDGTPWGPVAAIGLASERDIVVDIADFDRILEGRNSASGEYFDPRDWLIDEVAEAPTLGSETLAGHQAQATVAIIGAQSEEASRAVDCIVLEVAPGEEGQVEVLAVTEDNAVHTADQLPLPPEAVTAIRLTTEVETAWTGVVITGTQNSTGSLVTISVSGPLLPFAEDYIVERATSVEHNDWQQVAVSKNPSFTALVITGPAAGGDDISLRVAARGGLTRGPWSYFRTQIEDPVNGVSVARSEPGPTYPI